MQLNTVNYCMRIAVSKSQQFLVKVRRLFIFCSTTTQGIRLRRLVDVFSTTSDTKVGPNGFVKVTQKEYLRKVLERFGMSDCKPRFTPSEVKVESNGEELTDHKMYREAVGCLIHDMICTRPDICWIITKLSQYLSKPLEEHWV